MSANLLVCYLCTEVASKFNNHALVRFYNLWIQNNQKMNGLKVKSINNVVHGDIISHNINRDGLGRYIFDLISKHEEKVFKIDAITKEQQTYRVLNKQCVRVALEMRNRGIRKGDLILVISPNSIHVTIPVLATFYLNAVISVLDSTVSKSDIAQLVKEIRPKMVFVIRDLYETTQTVLREILPDLPIIVMDSNKRDQTEINISDLLVPNPIESSFIPDVVEDIKETALTLFSSGTTGAPKPIKCSHFGILYTIAGEMMCGYDYSVVLHYSSFQWISAYLFTISTFIEGGQNIINGSFNASTVLETCQKYKVTTLFLPTTCMHQFTTNGTPIHNGIYPKHIIYGGSRIDSDRCRKLYNQFPNSRIAFVYGLSEVSGFITTHPHNYYELLKTKPGSIGVPNPGVSIKISDLDTEETLPPNKEGEIRLFTKAFFNGYGDEDPSLNYDEDGFLKTGDIGYYDEDNCFFVTDRIKQIFKYRGWPITPSSVEDVLHKHPAVDEAIVVGIPHVTDENHPIAVVTVKTNFRDINEVDIQEFVNKQVTDREKLRGGVKIIQAFPQTPSGKIARNDVHKSIITGKINQL